MVADKAIKLTAFVARTYCGSDMYQGWMTKDLLNVFSTENLQMVQNQSVVPSSDQKCTQMREKHLKIGALVQIIAQSGEN